MGCGPDVAGEIRSAGVFVVSIILSTRTPRSIAREKIAPRMRAAMAAATSDRLVRALTIFLLSCHFSSHSDVGTCGRQRPNLGDPARASGLTRPGGGGE